MLEQIENRDSRRMQSLPWVEDESETGKCITIECQGNEKIICSFWGGDMRDPENMRWPTESQMRAHARYAIHCCNAFPYIQQEIERIYAMEDMPEEAVKAIESLMAWSYLPAEEMPPYGK